jgi:SulP family sulfate permease
MAFVPMAALAAILFVVAWGMSEYERFIGLMRMPNGDRGVLLLTFGLTVFVDLTVAIGVGVTIASLLFMMRMSESVQIEDARRMVPDADLDSEDRQQRDSLPDGVEVFRINGPFFFGVAADLLDTLRRIGSRPRVIILRMRLVPLLDASGAKAVREFIRQAGVGGAKVVLSGVQSQPAEMLRRADLGAESGEVLYASDYAAALALAQDMSGEE